MKLLFLCLLIATVSAVPVCQVKRGKWFKQEYVPAEDVGSIFDHPLANKVKRHVGHCTTLDVCKNGQTADYATGKCVDEEEPNLQGGRGGSAKEFRTVVYCETTDRDRDGNLFTSYEMKGGYVPTSDCTPIEIRDIGSKTECARAVASTDNRDHNFEGGWWSGTKCYGLSGCGTAVEAGQESSICYNGA